MYPGALNSRVPEPRIQGKLMGFRLGTSLAVTQVYSPPWKSVSWSCILLYPGQSNSPRASVQDTEFLREKKVTGPTTTLPGRRSLKLHRIQQPPYPGVLRADSFRFFPLPTPRPRMPPPRMPQGHCAPTPMPQGRTVVLRVVAPPPPTTLAPPLPPPGRRRRRPPPPPASPTPSPVPSRTWTRKSSPT